MKRIILGLVLCVLAAPVNAVLISAHGGDAYYDTVLDITWLPDANYAETNNYGVVGISTEGRMNWHTAKDWIAAMNVDSGSGYLGVNTWRLPKTTPLNGSAFNITYSTNGSTDWAYNISAPGTLYAGSTASEMVHLFYNTLGNIGGIDIVGNLRTGISGVDWGLVNSGPFVNVHSPVWSSSAAGNDAWRFSFARGYQLPRDKSEPDRFAWAVSDGNVFNAAVPIPAASWLFGSALGLLGWKRRGRS